MIVRSSLSTRPSIAAYMSVAEASQKMSLPRRCTVASIFCSSFSTDMMTFTSITLSKWWVMRCSLTLDVLAYRRRDRQLVPGELQVHAALSMS